MPKKRFGLIMWLSRAAAMAVILVIAVLIFTFLVRAREEPATTDADVERQRVYVITTTPQPVARTWEGFGTVRAMDTADVPTRVTSTVIALPPDLEPGVRVVEGQLIARLDASDFERQVEVAEFNLANLIALRRQLEIERDGWTDRVRLAEDDLRLAEAERARAVNARERDAANAREVDIAEQAVVAANTALVNAREQLGLIPVRAQSLDAQIESQRATKRLAELNVERCTITSPLDGYLDALDVETGENVVAGERIAHVISVVRVEVPLRMPSSARPMVDVGDIVTLHAAGNEARVWDAQITRIAPQDDPATRTVIVYVEVRQDADDGDRLAPGMFVRATVREHRERTRTVVPRRSVQDGQIIEVRNGTVTRRTVEIDYQLEQAFGSFGLPDRQWIVLRESLPEDTQIVVTATRSLADGMRIEPIAREAVAKGDDADEVPASNKGPILK